MTDEKEPDRLVVGISGASGVIYGVRLLKLLRKFPVETHLVMSRSAELTLAYETDLKVSELQGLADAVYPIGDLGAAISIISSFSLSFCRFSCVIRPVSGRGRISSCRIRSSRPACFSLRICRCSSHDISAPPILVDTASINTDATPVPSGL